MTCRQFSAPCPRSEPDSSSPQPHILQLYFFETLFDIFLSAMPTFSVVFFPQWFSSKGCLLLFSSHPYYMLSADGYHRSMSFCHGFDVCRNI